MTAIESAAITEPWPRYPCLFAVVVVVAVADAVVGGSLMQSLALSLTRKSLISLSNLRQCPCQAFKASCSEALAYFDSEVGQSTWTAHS
eukprot:448728-Amphidinium_carterae.1